MNPIEELLVKTQMVDKELGVLQTTVQSLSEEVKKKEEDFQNILQQQSILADNIEKEKHRVANLKINLDEIIGQISWCEEVESIQLVQCETLASSLRSKALSYIALTAQCVGHCSTATEQFFCNFEQFSKDLKTLEELQFDRQEIREIRSSFLKEKEDFSNLVDPISRIDQDTCNTSSPIEEDHEKLLEASSFSSGWIADDFYGVSPNEEMDQLVSNSYLPAISYNNTSSIINTPWYRDLRKRRTLEQGEKK